MLLGVIDGARCQVQIDIGFGDAVTPGPEDVENPVMLPEFAAPKLRVYPRYTAVAEKFEALSSLGIANSRMDIGPAHRLRWRHPSPGDSGDLRLT